MQVNERFTKQLKKENVPYKFKRESERKDTSLLF